MINGPGTGGGGGQGPGTRPQLKTSSRVRLGIIRPIKKAVCCRKTLPKMMGGTRTTKRQVRMGPTGVVPPLKQGESREMAILVRAQEEREVDCGATRPPQSSLNEAFMKKNGGGGKMRQLDDRRNHRRMTCGRPFGVIDHKP